MSIPATRRACRLRRTHIIRSLSTQPEPPLPSAPRRQWQPEENLRWLHPRMIFVRPWDGVPTMAHAFAIIREIERRFGKIQEFVVLRDSDVLTRSMPYMHATFARAEYTDAIPMEGRVIQVRMPTTDPDRPGGVGLDDLEEYLDPTARAEELSKTDTAAEGTAEAGPQVDTMMDVKLERTGMRTAPSPIDVVLGSRPRIQVAPLLRNTERARELAESLYAFGGFATPPKEPSDINKPKTRMQLLLKRWEIPKSKFRMVSRQPAPPREEPDKGSRSDTEPEPVPWTPFTDQREASASEPLPSTTPVSSGSMSSNFQPPTPLPIPAISPETTSSQNPSTTFHPTPPAPKSKPVVPKISKKQRMLLAARVAGTKAASQPAVNDYGSLQHPTESPAASKRNISAALEIAGYPAGYPPAESTDKSVDKHTSGNGTDDVAKRDEDNKRIANRWWAFLTAKK